MSALKVLIIGGVAGGMSAATRLRRLREDAEIIVFEMGEHVSYANCGLPYFVSNVISDRDSLLLQTPESLHRRFRLDVRVRSRVVEILPATKQVRVDNLATGESYLESYDKLVISTGAKPAVANIPGSERAIKLRDVTDADKAKELAGQLKSDPSAQAVILGAGFIGIELAENLRHLGLRVAVVQRGPSILSQFDPEMIEPLQAHLVGHGIELLLDATAVEITADKVVLADGRELRADLVASAIGVKPDNALAREAGLRIGESGGLWVDDQQRTSNPDIFAAGDAVEKLGMLTGTESLIPLANLANRHGRLVADVIAGIETKVHPALGTVIIGAFGLAAGITGLSERAAKRAGIAAQAIHLHPGSHAGYYPGAQRVSLKVLFDPKTGKLLGAQATGFDGVDKRIDVIATAIFGGLTIDDLMDLELAYSPQYGSAKDPINMAGYVGNNVLSGRTPTVQWHGLLEAQAGGATLIDVRTQGEHNAGAIPGSLLIPVDELRDRMTELPDGPLVVHCAVGQRGHIATQILRAAGREVRNLDGGYTTWKAGVDSVARATR